MASFLTAVVGFLGNIITGFILDLKISQSAKSRWIYVGIAVLVSAAWIWIAVVQVNFSSKIEPPSLDLDSGSTFGSAFAVYLFFRLFYEALQTYLYWLMGETGGEQRAGDISRTTGILRSWESIGSTFAYVVGATHWSNRNSMILSFVLWGVTVPFTLMAVFGEWSEDPNLAREDGVERPESVSDVEQQAVSVEKGDGL